MLVEQVLRALWTKLVPVADAKVDVVAVNVVVADVLTVVVESVLLAMLLKLLMLSVEAFANSKISVCPKTAF